MNQQKNQQSNQQKNQTKQNYQKILDRTIEELQQLQRVPTLLLHSCCAPCSSYVLEYLSEYFQITVLYYNPNIYPDEEYKKRVAEQKEFIERFPAKNQISFIEGRFNKEDFYYVRSLNVAIISLIIGKQMKLSDGILKKLGLGAILYDIGLVKVPEKILNKQYKHSPEEYAEIKKHTVYGYKLMKSNFRFEEEVAVISLEHHEYFNGKGYPRGISGNEIHLYAKIVAVAHEAEKVMKNRRIAIDEKSLNFNKNNNVEKKLLFDAVRHIIHGAKIKYDPTISKVFVAIFSVYPIGSVVILNDNRKGLVFATNTNFPIRPIIKIVSDNSGNIIENGEVVNLVENNQIFINGIDRDDKFLEEVDKKILNKD